MWKFIDLCVLTFDCLCADAPLIVCGQSLQINKVSVMSNVMLITSANIIAETLQFYVYCFIWRRTSTRCFSEEAMEKTRTVFHASGVKLNVGHITKISKPMLHFFRYSNIAKYSL